MLQWVHCDLNSERFAELMLVQVAHGVLQNYIKILRQDNVAIQDSH